MWDGRRARDRNRGRAPALDGITENELSSFEALAREKGATLLLPKLK